MVYPTVTRAQCGGLAHAVGVARESRRIRNNCNSSQPPPPAPRPSPFIPRRGSRNMLSDWSIRFLSAGTKIEGVTRVRTPGRIGVNHGPRTLCSYLRVSTDRQGRSGLGVEAERAAVENYLNGGSWTLVAEFVEVESGKRNDRPSSRRGAGMCRLHGAKLVIAKMDRLARNVAFISNLMESGADFVAVDFPQPIG